MTAQIYATTRIYELCYAIFLNKLHGCDTLPGSHNCLAASRYMYFLIRTSELLPVFARRVQLFLLHPQKRTRPAVPATAEQYTYNTRYLALQRPPLNIRNMCMPSV